MKTMVVLLAMFSLTACITEPAPTTFVLRNDGDTDIYHNVSRWLSLEVDGRPAFLNEPGCMARCGAFPQQIACAAVAEYPTTRRLGVGEEEEVEWDGTYYEVRPGESCFRERRAAKRLEAVFCYGHEVEAIDGAPRERIGAELPGTTVTDEVCESAAFERGGTVELLAE